MKKFVLLLSLIAIPLCTPDQPKAQTIELLAGNTFNGAMNGTILGGATMALADQSSDLSPLRVGVGLGILYGIGTGIYDLSYGKGSELVVSGLFNDGNNSSVIVLLDTFYGVAAGGVVVTAVLLVANEPILDGLQYGAGIGAWVGFGFGLFDAFVLADRITGPGGFGSNYQPVNKASGLVGISLDDKKSIGLLNPTLHRQIDWNATGPVASITPAIEFMNLRLNF